MNDGDKRTSKSSYLSLLLVLLIALMAAWPVLAGPGMINTRAGGDSPFLLQRVFELSQSLANGEFPVRWMAGGAQGLGYPFYNYYAALPYYVASILNLLGLGVIGGIQATQILGFVIAAVATYGLAMELGHKRPAAIAASAIYTFAPFHLINVYVRGDSLSEFYAMALFPVILYAAHRLVRQPSFWRFAGLAAAFAGLMLSHNISAMLFTPLVVIWIVILALKSEKRWQSLLLGGSALVLGLGLSAWFWLPALWEQSLVQLGDQTTGYFDFRGHLTNAFVQQTLIHDYTITADNHPFAMGGIQTIIGLMALAATLWGWIKHHKIDPLTMLIAVSTLGYTWLMMPSSQIVWENVPLLAFTQFPWRLLSIQSLGIALLAPVLFTSMPSRWQKALSLCLIAGMLLCGMAGLELDYLPINEADVTTTRLFFYETYSGNTGTTIRNEYLPADFVPRPQTSAIALGDRSAAPLVLEGSVANAALVEYDTTSQTWAIEVQEQALLAFHTTFFPGWEATVDGQPQGIEPLAGLGLCGLRLAPGSHIVSLYLTHSTVRDVAEVASLIALIILVGLLVVPGFADKRRRRKLLAGSCITLLVFVWTAFSPFSPRPASLEGPLVADFGRAPYLHAEPDGLLFDGSNLIGYEYSDATLLPGETLAVAMQWNPNTTTKNYQVELELVSATAHLYEPAPIWARARGSQTDSELLLDIPDDLAPGFYLLRLYVIADNSPIQATTQNGVEMSTPVLAPIRISVGGETDSVAPLGQFSPENQPAQISLLNIQAERVEPSLACIEMTWRSERQASFNYMLSVRLIAPDGTNIVSRDLPPLLGNYPTSLWMPQDTFIDRVLIPIDGELASGPYTIQLVLYDRLTLKGAGVVSANIDL